jgi:hypothetical protein
MVLRFFADSAPVKVTTIAALGSAHRAEKARRASSTRERSTKARMLYEILGESGGEMRELATREVAHASHGDEAAIERRLRALGYVD